MKLSLHHEHSWEVAPGEAIKIQHSLRRNVLVQPLHDDAIKWVGGVDADIHEDQITTCAIIMEYITGRMVESASVSMRSTFPYIPGLLSFREAPGILAALARLNLKPDVLIIDGHGFAHPRRFGIACHLGILLDLPTIGCAKSVLTGTGGYLAEEVGSQAELVDGEEVIGMILRTRAKVKPVYVSIGHLVDLDSAVHIVMACVRGYRLPEPTRMAHIIASKSHEAVEQHMVTLIE